MEEARVIVPVLPSTATEDLHDAIEGGFDRLAPGARRTETVIVSRTDGTDAGFPGLEVIEAKAYIGIEEESNG
jgi:hypothetical protein